MDPLNLASERMHVSHAHQLRKTGRTLVWGSYRAQNGGPNIKSFITNDETEFKI